jgi:hypothetical protein
MKVPEMICSAFPCTKTETSDARRPSIQDDPKEKCPITVSNELTQAVRKFGAEQRRVPKTLEEVAAGGYLSRIPQAPAGKKFAIDKNLQVYLASP